MVDIARGCKKDDEPLIMKVQQKDFLPEIKSS